MCSAHFTSSRDIVSARFQVLSSSSFIITFHSAPIPRYVVPGCRVYHRDYLLLKGNIFHPFSVLSLFCPFFCRPSPLPLHILTFTLFHRLHPTRFHKCREVLFSTHVLSLFSSTLFFSPTPSFSFLLYPAQHSPVPSSLPRIRRIANISGENAIPFLDWDPGHSQGILNVCYDIIFSSCIPSSQVGGGLAWFTRPAAASVRAAAGVSKYFPSGWLCRYYREREVARGR